MPARNRGRWPIALAILFLLAFGLRWYYVATAIVDSPIRGDATQYYAYAWNLVHHGVFSKAPPESPQVLPDSFRDPGYPLFLAAWMKVTDSEQQWYAMVLLSQALLGALIAILTAILARRWLPTSPAIVVGLLMAIWPHCIVINSLILAETLFTFFLVAAILVTCIAHERRSRTLTVIAGLLFGAGSLVNAVLTPFAPLVAVWLAWRRGTPKVFSAILFGAALLLPGPWALRGQSIADGASAGSRAMINIVQGSRPEYFKVYRGARIRNDAEDLKSLSAIDDEQNRFIKAPLAGSIEIWNRIAAAPLDYVAWYVVRKPLLLWGWDIEIGQGDIYVFPTVNSPFERSAGWRVLAAVCRALNPWVLLWAMGGVILLWRWKKRERSSPAEIGPALTAFVLLYATAIYDIFQSEPRYAIPFRGYEICACVTAVALALQWVKLRLAQGQ